MSNYWEERAARRMYEDMKTAEEAAEDIRKLYTRASRYIQSQGEEIFEAFRRQTGLSEAEARRYLTQAKNPADVQAVIEFAKQIQDPARRQELLNWIKASATQSRLARLATLQDAIDTLVPMLYAQEMKYHQDAYRKIIQDAYLHKTFDIQQYAGFGKFVEPMDEKRIDKLMRERWLGSNYSSRLWGNTDRLAKALRDELMVSFLTGRPQLATWRAIDAEFHKGQHAARRLVRTESNYLANQGHAEAYKDSGVEKYIYVAVLDMKTSEICRGLDGKRFLVKNAQPGVNYPPMHPWCRSTTIAWLPEQLLARMKRTARDPITGRNYKIPANMTYNEWYKKYVKNNQNTAQPKYGERNLTRVQYDNYKARLGDDFPYSYDEFIKMKADKETWLEWQKKYRNAGKLSNNAIIKNIIDTTGSGTYNNSPTKKGRDELRGIYNKAVEDGWISPLSGFDNYCEQYDRMWDEVIGQKTVDGINIDGMTDHFMERLIGTGRDPKKYIEDHKIIRRSGVPVDDIKDALFNGTVRGAVTDPETGLRSKKYIGSKCIVTLNPDSQRLIQCNPKRSK